MRSELLYLKDIVEASDMIAGFLEGHSEQSFLESDIIKSAVAYKLTNIGEACSKISVELQKHNPDIPWNTIKGFRNIITHAYFSVYWISVWNTARFEVPKLRLRIFEILQQRYPGADQNEE